MATVKRLPSAAPAIVYRAFGGPDVLRCENVPVPLPLPGEVLLRHTAIGVNFSDANARSGTFYRGQREPGAVIPGNEGVGEIVALGDDVHGFKVGDRVAYVGMGGAFFENTGAYSTYRAVPAARLIHLPDELGDIEAAGLLMKGLTASGLINRFHKPQAGDTVLIHAAASGVGLILCHWARHLGARVIGTVGSGQKADIASKHGCEHPILYRELPFVEEVRKLCPEGVDAVYDGVGKDTLLPSLDCLRSFGRLINYGNASGAPPAIDLLTLSKKGSLSVSRFALGDHVRELDDYHRALNEVLDLYAAGTIRPLIGTVMPLSEAAAAHRLLESGKSIGTIVLVP